MKKTIVGISLFMVQIALAVFYNQTVDLVVILGLFTLTFLYILYKYYKKRYSR